MKRKGFILMLAIGLITLFGAAQLTLANDGTELSTTEIITVVEDLHNDGQISNESAVRALTMHLTAVKHYEQQGKTDKVIEHMSSFKLLLEHQLDNELIDESAYDVLLENTNALIQRWDDLTIVQDGEANAIVIASSETASTNTPSWSRWSNFSGDTIKRSEDFSYSGDSSLVIEGMQQGGVWQVVDVQPGTVNTQIYYYTDETSEGQIRIGMNLRDANNQNISALRSDTVQLADTTGEWTLLSLEGIIPESVNGREIVRAQVTITVENSEDVPVYFDDYLMYQDEGQTNLLLNPGFEERTLDDERVTTFVNYVAKSTGVELPVFTSEPANDDRITIYIGRSRDQDEVRHQALLQDLNEHGYMIDSQEGNITIVGTTDRATRFGVYEFLERYLGVRWLMPGPDGEHVPLLDSLKIPQEVILEEPATISRHFFFTWDTDVNEWAQLNRMHDNIQFHHNMSELFDPEVFADHPEYYADGEVPTHEYSWQPCFNEVTAEVAIDRIIEYFNANPDASSYSLGINDGTNFCEKEGHPDYTDELNSVGRLHRSDVYYPWVNQIAEGVTEVHPDKYLGLLAYREMFDPPKNEDGTPYLLHPNVIPYITDDRMSWIDPDVKKIGTDNMEAWQQSATNLGWYEYLYGAAYSIPRTYLQVMNENYKYAQEQGVIGHVAELYPNFGGEGPKSWVSAKLQWNPDHNVDALLEDWYHSAVGEDAAPYLQEYYEFWEEVWTERMLNSSWFRSWADSERRGNYLNFNDLTYLIEVTKEEIEYTRQLLQQVVAHAGPGKQQVRAERFLQAFDYYESSVLSYPVGGNVEMPANEEDALVMLDRVVESYEMASRRNEIRAEFQSDPILRMYGRNIGAWDGILISHITVLEEYVALHPGGVVEEQLNQFLEEIGYVEVSANAVKTTASKEDILQALDFSQGPWTAAQSFNNFNIMDTDNIPPGETNVYLLWDEENLYVGYENFDDDLSNMIVSDEAPNGWWGSGADDSVETFVTGNPGEAYLGFFTNPNAVKFSRYQRSIAPEVEWEASANIGTDRWNTVQVIPFAEIGVDPTETATVQAFFFRNYHGNSVYIGWDGGAPWRAESLRPVNLVN